MASGIDKIGALAKRIEQLGTPSFKQEVNRQLAAETVSLLREEFKSKTGPYGNNWAPTQQKNPILVKSGTLMEEWSTSASPEGFRVRSQTDYGVYQQYGTAKITARPIVPLASQGLSEKWANRYKAVAGRLVKEALKP